MLSTAKNISDRAAEEIYKMILDGRLRDGARINEVHLAETLGISRTPLREGLRRLAADQLVTAQPRRGFFVAPLTAEEFEQLFDLRPLLDPEALRLAGVPAAEVIDRLEKLNRRLQQRARTARKAVELDNLWHMTLIEGCPNRVLLELVQQFISRMRRYEYALFRETDHTYTTSDEHARVNAALRDGDLGAACRALKTHLEAGKSRTLDWLRAREMSVSAMGK